MSNKTRLRHLVGPFLVVLAFVLVTVLQHPRRAQAQSSGFDRLFPKNPADRSIAENIQRMTDEGRSTFRFATFGDEAFWGDTIKLHQALAGSKLGGVGPGVSPKTALSVGLKVDVDALPR